MTTIAAGTKFDFSITDGRQETLVGVAVAAESPNENGWFQAHDLDGGEWILNEAHVTETYQEEEAVERTEYTPEFIRTRLEAFAAEAKRSKKSVPTAVISEAEKIMALVWEQAFKAGQTHGLQAAFQDAFAEAPANPFSA